MSFSKTFFALGRDIHLLETAAVCQILWRALGLHHKTRSDFACGAAGVLPTCYLAAHLHILRPIPQQCRLPQHIARRIRELQLAGTKPSLAAHIIWTADVPPELLHQSMYICSLLTVPDSYSHTMAYHISWPSALC